MSPRFAVVIAATLGDAQRADIEALPVTPRNLHGVRGRNVAVIHITDAARALSIESRRRIARELAPCIYTQPQPRQDRLGAKLWRFAEGITR